MAHIDLINYKYNQHIYFNKEIFELMCLILLIITIFLVTKFKLKTKESSPERVIRLKKKKDQYKIDKLLNNNKTSKLINDEVIKKNSISKFVILNNKRPNDSFNIDEQNPKRFKEDALDLYCDEVITPRIINKQYINENTEQRNKRLESQLNKRKLTIKNETPEQIASRVTKYKTNNYNKRSLIKEFDQSASISKFNNEIFELIDKTCVICHRKFYKEGVSNFRIKEKINFNLCKAGYDFTLDSSIITCHSCKSSLNSNRLPSMSYLNNLNPGNVPDQLKKLNPIELSCISRVKPYMKIMKMNNVFGQSTFKGNVVHFAQSIEEVYEQLPLKLIDCDNIIVTEKRENVTNIKQFNIRPKLLLDGLIWLKNNNQLYSNVEIVDRLNEDFNIDNIIVVQAKDVTPIDVIPIEDLFPIITDQYKEFKDGIAIISGKISQNSKIFKNSNSQCAAMCMIAIVYSHNSKITVWTTEIIDSILLKGDIYYQNCYNRLIGIKNRYLSIEEVVGVIEVNQIVFDTSWIYNPNISKNSKQISDRIFDFNLSNSKHALIVTGVYCFALIKEADSIYFFDSHSRSPQGKASLNGKACVIRFKGPKKEENLTNHILKFVNLNNITIEISSINCLKLTPLSIPVIVFNNDEQTTVTHINNDKVDIESNLENSIYQPDNQSGGDNDYIDVLHTAFFPIEHEQPNKQLALDILTTNKTFELKRTTVAPISSHLNEHLEELSFINIFPFGVNGMNHQRTNLFQKLTVGSYAKSRVMSNEPRYQCVDYMFYLLSKLELEKIKSCISICSSRLKKKCNDRVDDLHVYMKCLRGYSSYWNTAKSDLLAMIRHLGSPSWFITLSANDLNWPNLIKDLLYSKHLFENNEDKNIPFIFNLSDVSKMTYKEKAQLLHDYPVIAARHFDRRFRKLTSFLLSDDKILGGKIVDFWWRTEFQHRGSPHIHMLIWISNLPEFNTVDGVRLIEDCISCSLATENLKLNDIIKKCQKHKCKATCFKKSKDKCRFNYPMIVSNETRILSDEEIVKNNNKFVIMKRNKDELFINNYHPIILNMWQANMDIQPIGTVFGIAFYVAKYVAKEEPVLIQKKIHDAIKEIKNSTNNEFVNKIRNVANIIIKNRERSAQEAAYVLCSLKLRESSRSTVFVNTKPPQHRTRLVRKESLLNTEFDEEDFCSDIFDKYTSRPIVLENLCLHQFASEYKVKPKKTNSFDDENEDCSEEEEEVTELLSLKLLNSQIHIQKRKKAAVIKTPHVCINDNQSEYYYSLLVLYVPFRNEDNILSSHDSVENAYIHHFTNACNNEYIKIIEKTEQLARAIELINILRDSSQTLKATTGCILENNDFVRADDEIADDLIDETDNLIQLETDNNNYNHLELNKSIVERIKLLNEKQKNIFNKVKSNLTSNNGQFLQIIHGAGGTGKSFLAEIIKDLVILYEHSENNPNNNLHVIISAPTGVAAKNIKGITNHMAFKLPIEKFGLGTLSLKGKCLDETKRKWKHVKWIIIDEISMISYEVLRQIHLRTQQIKENDNLPFGGLNVILMGDLLQLKPVFGHWIYDQPEIICNEINLWEIFKMDQLDQNQRQISDTRYADLCARIRLGTQTSADIELLNSRLLSNLKNKNDFKNCLYIMARKVDVSKHNLEMAALLEKSSKSYKIKAKDTYADGPHASKIADQKYFYAKEEKCGGMVDTLNIAVGSRIMLRRNMDTSKGLVNGSIGTITAIEWPMLSRDQLNEGDLPESILVKFDDKEIANKMSFLDKVGDSVRIRAHSVTFEGKKNTHITRRMFPIILSWAITIHKTQGLTIDKAVISLTGCFGYNMEYVALSRIKTINGLAILNIDIKRFNENKFTCPDSLLQLKKNLVQ